MGLWLALKSWVTSKLLSQAWLWKSGQDKDSSSSQNTAGSPWSLHQHSEAAGGVGDGGACSATCISKQRLCQAAASLI